ncbi:MFS transporter [Lysinimonas soli]|uniref:MFS transporter n=1 Tax=Lysinimonas soli TaxID=1074233 RepID=A0ABW0NPD1_9MICO
MSSAFRSLGIFNYRLWFAGVTVSNVGTWMQRTAQDWVVLTELTHNDAGAVGVTMALQFGPQLVLVPITGLVADRMDPRRLLMITQGAMGAMGLGLGILTLTGVLQLWMMFLFALALGVAAAFDAPVRQTFVGSLVPQGFLSNAVGLNATSFNTARLIGPAVAGLLIAGVGSGWVFLTNALTFGATMLALAGLRTSELAPRTGIAKRRGQIRAGLAYVRGRPDLMVLFLMVFLMGTLGLNFPIFASTMASTTFHQGAGEFGILSSAFAVGSVVGALLAARREKPRFRTVGLSGAGFGFALIAAALMPSYLSFGLVLPLVGITSITMLNNANAYVQTTTPPELRGRVMSLYMAIFMGGTPIGAPLIGWVANVYGPRWGLIVGAFGGLLAALVALVWWTRSHKVRIRYPHEGWMPFGLEVTDDRDLATTEIAVIETEAQKG